jgi:hypothetical protein
MTQNKLTAILSTNQMTTRANKMTKTAVKGFFIKFLSMAFRVRVWATLVALFFAATEVALFYAATEVALFYAATEVALFFCGD